jgi:hypothetical protein
MRLRSLPRFLGAIVLLSGCARESAPIRAALGPDAASETELRLLLSVDKGSTWVLQPQVVAHGVSSLHACTYEGTVWVPAILDVRDIPWYETAFPSPFVDVFRSDDLVTWRADRVPIQSSRIGGIDPACVVGPAGLEMWFAEPAGRDGDPAQGGRRSQIWRTHWNGTTFGAGEVVYTGLGLVDPAPSYLAGELRLFLNADGDHIVEVAGGTLTRVWEHVTVPQVAELGDRRLLLAQRPSGPGMQPTARVLEGTKLGAEVQIPIQNALRSCESPSLTALGSTWALFCVDASQRPVPTERPGVP